MIRNAPRIPARAAALAALMVLAALASRSSRCEAIYICPDCMSINDTASTPGKVAISRYLISRAIKPPAAFIGKDSLLRCALPASPGWQIEIVEPGSTAGGCSMELDPMLDPFIAYHDANGMLFLARRLGGGWSSEPIDPISMVMGGTSIARVPGGFAIAYVDAITQLLKYAEQNAGGSWNVEVVAPVGAREGYPSLIVDDMFRAISYYDASSGDLRLAQRQVGGPWSTSLIDGAGDVGGYTSLVGGLTQGLGVAYYDFTHADLRYARAIPGGWAIETVDGAGESVGKSCSAVAFAGSPEDMIGIAYYDRTHGDLKYALRQGAIWTTTVLDTTGNSGESLSCGGTPIPGDTLGVAYVDRASGNLSYLSLARAVAAAPVPGPSAMPVRVAWIRSADGAGGRIRFSVPASGDVRVKLFDAQGRLIGVPLRATLPAGSAEARWDGRDAHGAALGAGVFFVRVETVGGIGTTRAVLLP